MTLPATVHRLLVPVGIVLCHAIQSAPPCNADTLIWQSLPHCIVSPPCHFSCAALSSWDLRTVATPGHVAAGQAAQAAGQSDDTPLNPFLCNAPVSRPAARHTYNIPGCAAWLSGAHGDAKACCGLMAPAPDMRVAFAPYSPGATQQPAQPRAQAQPGERPSPGHLSHLAPVAASSFVIKLLSLA